MLRIWVLPGSVAGKGRPRGWSPFLLETTPVRKVAEERYLVAATSR